MSNQDAATVRLVERVRVVKTNLDHPEQPPEIIEQESAQEITLDQAALLGFLPGQGFRLSQPGDADQPVIQEGDSA